MKVHKAVHIQEPFARELQPKPAGNKLERRVGHGGTTEGGTLRNKDTTVCDMDRYGYYNVRENQLLLDKTSTVPINIVENVYIYNAS